MALEYGALAGLAVTNPIDQRIADTRYHDQVMKQNQAMAEAKAKMFADDMNYQNAANEYDNPRIKAFADTKIREIGKYYKENPDLLYNPDKLVVFNQMRRELKDNPEIIRGLASDDSFKKMNAYLAEAEKNPAMHNQVAIAKMKEAKANYLKYGNAGGLEAFEKEGAKPFVFERPRDFIDLTKTGQELGNKFQDLKAVQLKNGRSGAWETRANETTLNKDAMGFYLENKEQFDQQHGANALNAAKEYIRSGIPYKFDWGSSAFAEQVALLKMRNAADLEEIKAKNAKGGGGISAYRETILKPSRTATSPEFLDKTFGSKIKHQITNDNGSVRLDNTGDVFNYNGDIQDQNYSTGKYKPNGIKTVSGYVYKPLKWGEENGVVINKDWFGDIEESNDVKIDGGWAQTASIVDVPVGNDGKTMKMLKLNVRADVLGNDASYEGKYNSIMETTDQRNAVPLPATQGSQQFIDEAGNVFDAQGNFLGKAK